MPQIFVSKKSVWRFYLRLGEFVPAISKDCERSDVDIWFKLTTDFISTSPLIN